MGFEGVKINKLNGGLSGSNGSGDSIMALIYAIALADLPVGVVHNEVFELRQTSDLTAHGFTVAHDANEDLLVNHTVTEFFRLAPEATLYLIPVPVAAPSAIMEVTALKAVIRQLESVKGLAIAGTVETAVALADEVEEVQAVVDAFRAEHRLIDFVILSGKGDATPTAISAYPDLREKNAPNVTVSIAQDPGIAAWDASYSKYADIGAVLGMLAVRQVNENLGSVNILNKPSIAKGDPDYPLTNAGKLRWLSATLSDGTLVSGLSSADKKALTDKGYIYAGSYAGYDGVFFNSSPTAVELASDYSYIERNRVWNKAARLIRNTLIPEVKGVVKKDPTTGYIKSTTISRWTGLLNKALEAMASAEEISGFGIYIDPKQVLSASSPLLVKANVVADDVVHEFEVDLGLTKTA
jgi:hypothetical protein